MSKLIAQSIFTENVAAPRTWQSYATSVGIHAAIITALLFVTFPAMQEITQPREHVTLVDPIAVYKPKVTIQPVVHQRIPIKPILKPIVQVQPKKFIPPPPVVKPVTPVQMAKAPEIKVQQPVVQERVIETKVETPAPPKPIVKTGVFQNSDLAKATKVPNQLKVGGFGDPNGVHPTDTPSNNQLTMAKVGSFDMPNGAGQSGGGGRAQNGGVRAGGFGSVDSGGGGTGGTGTGHGSSVKTGAFGEASAGPQHGPTVATPSAPSTTPVEILFKPRPVYSPEAKQLGLEGQVALEVVFGANGSIHVIRVVRGLGHGLDESALQAASQVRFRPATRGGVAVDTNATIYITFQTS